MYEQSDSLKPVAERLKLDREKAMMDMQKEQNRVGSTERQAKDRMKMDALKVVVSSHKK